MSALCKFRGALAPALIVGLISQVFSISADAAGFVTSYADYYPQKTAVFFEFNGESNQYKTLVEEVLKSPFYQDLLTGKTNLSKPDANVSKLFDTFLSHPVAGTTGGMIALDKNSPSLDECLAWSKLSVEIYQKLLRNFELSFSLGVWLDAPLETEKTQLKKRASRHPKSENNSVAFQTLSHYAPSALMGVTLREGQSIDNVIKDWKLDTPKTMSCKMKTNPSIPARLYFYTDSSNKAVLYFYQQGQKVFISNSFLALTHSLTIQSNQDNLATSPMVAELLPKLPEDRLGSVVLQLPDDVRGLVHEFANDFRSHLAEDKTEESKNYLRLLNKFEPLLDLSSAIVGSYEMAATPSDLNEYVYGFHYYSKPIWEKLPDLVLRADLENALVPKGKLSFSELLPEDIVFSIGYQNLSTVYDLVQKHIAPYVSELLINMQKADVAAAAFDIHLRKNLLGLFDTLTAFSIGQIDPKQSRYDAVAFLNGGASAQEGKDKILTLAKLYANNPAFFGNEILIPKGPASLLPRQTKSLERATLPYREHGVKKEANIFIGDLATNVMAVGTDTLMTRLPAYTDVKTLAQSEGFKKLSEGMPNIPLYHFYLDYHKMMNLLVENSQTAPSYLKSLYGPGTVYLLEGSYDKAAKLLILEGRFNMVLGKVLMPPVSSTLNPNKNKKVKH